jgi:hypothetical protein
MSGSTDRCMKRRPGLCGPRLIKLPFFISFRKLQSFGLGSNVVSVCKFRHQFCFYHIAVFFFLGGPRMCPEAAAVTEEMAGSEATVLRARSSKEQVSWRQTNAVQKPVDRQEPPLSGSQTSFEPSAKRPSIPHPLLDSSWLQHLPALTRNHLAVRDRWPLGRAVARQSSGVRAPMAPQPLHSLRLSAPATGHAACRCPAAPLSGKRLPLVVAFPRSGSGAVHCSVVQESSASTAGTHP